MSRFHALRDIRLSVVTGKIRLLENLGRRSYGSTEAERREIVETIEEATSALRRAYRLPEPPPEPADPVSPASVPDGVAIGGSAFEHEVKWALDAIERGDSKLAANRLRRILKAP